MFFHNFKYALKKLIRNRMLLFWTFAFPIILGTFFSMAFSDIENSEKLHVIDIAIVENDVFENNLLYKETFLALGDKNSDEQLFSIQYVDLAQAEELLSKDEIVGYLFLDKTPQIVIGANGINETIFKYVVEQIGQMEDVFQASLENKLRDSKDLTSLDSWYVELYQQTMEYFNKEQAMIQDISSTHLNYTMIEYYTLIAMTCLYGGILGMNVINQCLANMSSNGKRTSISPSSKWKLIFSSALAGYIVQVFGLLLLFLYTIFVLQVDYGSHFFLVVLLSLIGSFAGLSLGVFIASLFPSNENTKFGIIISVTMLGCFFSGMMGITMKYVVDQSFPLVNYLNPANMITDGLYALYYYNTLDRFCFNLVSLFLFSFVLILISIFSLRRQKYDSI
ncbi:MAG: ABC transporter permease [Bacilli bacterium]|nr:ABC transporter permease [Bacilli bacterium]